MIKSITPYIKSLHLTFLLFFVLSSLVSFAQVDITKFTGGSEISADLSLGSTNAGFKTLDDFVLKATTSGDFVDSQAGQTIILKAPENWKFNAGVGTATYVGGFTSANVAVTADEITITFSTSNVSIGDSITISGIQVQAQEKTILPLQEIRRIGGTAFIVGFEVDSVCGELSQVAGDFVKLQILFPGETAASGTPEGKTGSPTPQLAGVPFNIIVNAVDENWNVVSIITDPLSIQTAELDPIEISNESLISGALLVEGITLKKAGSYSLKVLDEANDMEVTSVDFLVNPGAYSKLQLLLPGEIAAPGTEDGKTGTLDPAVFIVGAEYEIRINAVDEYWNVVESNNQIKIQTIESVPLELASAILNNGTLTLSNIVFKTAGVYSISVNDEDNQTIDAATSAELTVNPGAFAKLQILLPGETAAPGTLTGKTGTPDEFTVGDEYEVIVNAVDENWNLIREVDDEFRIYTQGSNSIELANGELIDGTLIITDFVFTLAGTYSIHVDDIVDINIIGDISSELTIASGDFAQIQILLPGELAQPGTYEGKTGQPNIPQRGSQFSVNIKAVDYFFNEIALRTGEILITSSDVNAEITPIIFSLENMTSSSINVNILERELQTLTAKSADNNFITSVDLPDPGSSLYFRTLADGSWNTPVNWESSIDNSIWNAATRSPGQQDQSVVIGHNIFIDNDTDKSFESLIINSGKTLDLRTGKLTIINAQISGELKNSGRLELLTGTMVFKSGSKYQHNFTTTLGVVPQATWEDGSLCEIIGYTTAMGRMVGINGQSFYNFTWNSPNQNTVNGIGPSLGLLEGAITEVRNNFTVQNTGTTGGFQLSTANAELKVKNYIQNGGKFGLINRNNGSFEAVLNVLGDFNLNGGTLQKGNGTGVSASKAKVVFNGASVQEFTKTDGTLAGNLNFEIASGATVDFGTNVLGNDGTFEMKAGAGLWTKHLEGISKSEDKGNIQSKGDKIYHSGTNFTYNGEALQETGDGLPATVAKLTIDNMVGVKLTASDVLTVTETLNVRQGFFDLIESSLISSTNNLGSGILFTQNKGDNPLNTGGTWNVTVVYNAVGSQTVVDGNYGNLIVKGGGVKTISPSGNNVFIGKLLSVLSPTELVTNNKLVISATLISQGAIGPLLDGAEISGNVRVEHFIHKGSGVRGTRMLSSPIDDSGLTEKTFKQLKKYVVITGAGGIGAGFDPGSTALSLVTYKESSHPKEASSFVPVGNLNTSSSIPGHGFQLYFRGNINDINLKVTSNQPTEDVKITYDGPINKGDIGGVSGIPIGFTPNSDLYDGYFLAGNPYPAPLDWHKVLAASSNLSSTITFVEGGRNNLIYNATENAAVNGEEWAGRNIQVGQAFYISTGSSTGTLNFKEDQKATPDIPSLILENLTSSPQARIANAPLKQKVMINNQLGGDFNNDALISNLPTVSRGIKMTLSSNSFKEETRVFFNPKYEAIADLKDSKYFLGYDITLATLSEDEKSLAINLMPDINEVDSLKLEVNSAKETNLRLQFNEIASISDRAIHLKDNYLDTLISITADGAYYDFTLDKKIAETYGKSRFVLLFAKPIPPVVQPGNFQAKKEDNKSLLTWASGLNIHGGKFEVERSSDGLAFSKIGEVNLNVDSDNLTSSYIDQFPLNGNNYYRIKQIDAEESHTYSAILKLSYETLDPQEDEIDLKIYPNPVKEYLTVDYKSDTAQTVVLSIYNLQGQRLKRYKFLSGETARFSLSDLKQGVYIMELKALENNKVIVSRKFIKE